MTLVYLIVALPALVTWATARDSCRRTFLSKGDCRQQTTVYWVILCYTNCVLHYVTLYTITYWAWPSKLGKKFFTHITDDLEDPFSVSVTLQHPGHLPLAIWPTQSPDHAPWLGLPKLTGERDLIVRCNPIPSVVSIKQINCPVRWTDN